MNQKERRKKSDNKYLSNEQQRINNLDIKEQQLFNNFYKNYSDTKYLNLPEEIWMDIVGYEGLYQISNFARVKSIRKNIILKPCRDQKGYGKSFLSKNGKAIYPIISRLVAEAFIPNPENKPEVNHINGIRIDNRVENLEWVSTKENANHLTNTLSNRSKRQIVQLSKEGDFIRIWDSIASAGRYINKPIANIVSTCQGKFNYAYGFKWMYLEDYKEII